MNLSGLRSLTGGPLHWDNPLMDKTDAIVLLGPTGSGKTPLGDALAAEGLWGRRCAHFDFGNELRSLAAAPGPPYFLSEADGSLVQNVLASGALLEDERFYIAERMLIAFLAEAAVGEGWVVLNGMPRHLGQARDIEPIVSVRAVVELRCTPQGVSKRLAANTGGDRTGRTDDQPDAVDKKLQIYTDRVEPLIDYYRDRGVRVETLDVAATTDATDMRHALETRRE